MSPRFALVSGRFTASSCPASVLSAAVSFMACVSFGAKRGVMVSPSTFLARPRPRMLEVGFQPRLRLEFSGFNMLDF